MEKVIYAECASCLHQQKVKAGQEGMCEKCYGPLIPIRATLK